MAIVTPTLEGIINSFIDNLRATLPEASTTPISVIRESLINPTSAQLSALYSVAQRISVLQNIFEAEGTDLDNIATTYNITRRTGTTSSGSIEIDLGGLLNANSITVPAGTLVRTAGSSSGTTATFSTVGTNSFLAVDRASYEAAAAANRSALDSIGYTSVSLIGEVPITSTSAGSNTNVGAFTLNSSAIPGVSRITNINATSGGTDSESDDALRNRIVAVFTGNSVGTIASLLSAALATPGITSGFAVKYGDPLMTRDGTVFDSSGNIIIPGTGRSVDIYIQGISLNTNTETQQFKIKDTNNFLSVNNSFAIGQPAVGTTFGFLPIFAVSSITGNESGATFAQASPVTDAEGNIILQGNFALISDVIAGNYSIIENLVTGARKLASFVSPVTSTYTIVETFASSNYANSPFSQDRVVFLQDTVAITAENVTRGTFNGADQLQFSNVTDISSVSDQQTITETIKVESLVEVPGGVAIQVRNTPIISVVRVTNTRLGTTYTTQVTDAANGIIQLVGRFPPRSGDYLQVQYIWKSTYVGDLHYTLAGDLVDWSPVNQNVTDATLLPLGSLQSENLLAIQPPVPAHLRFAYGAISDREIITTTIKGTVVDFVNDQLTLTTSTPYRYALTGLSNVGRIFKVANTTQGFNYNLAGYELRTNQFDPRIGVSTSLLPQQFQLSTRTNAEVLAPGDKIVLACPSETIALSSQADFDSNIGDNIAPLFDPTQLDFTAGGIILKTPLLDTTSPVTTISGIITQDLTLSGLVNVTDDLIVSDGITLTIEPSTVIQITPSAQLNSQLLFTQSIFFDPALVQAATVGTPVLPYAEFLYLFFKPAAFVSGFFTIINDSGQTLSIRFNQDILTKDVSGPTPVYYVNGVRVPATFNTELEAAIDLDDITTSLKATLLGARTGVSGTVQFVAARIPALNKYYLVLEASPIITSSLLTDFTLAVTTDPTITFQRFSYNGDVNSLIVDGSIIAPDGYGSASPTTIISVTTPANPNQGSTVVVNDASTIVVGASLYQSFPSPDPSRLPTNITAVVLAVNTLTNTLALAPTEVINAAPPVAFVPGPALITSGSADPTEYSLSFVTSQKRRLSIIVDGTLLVLGATPQTSVLFTSAAGSASSPGDWEGIIFTAKSNSQSATAVFQSDLNNSRIRFANTGVNIQASDVNVQNCIIRDCLSVGVSVASGLRSRAQYSQAGFNLAFSAFVPATRVGFTAADGLQLARYPIADNMVTSVGNLPTLTQKLTDTSYVVGFTEAIDEKVFINLQRATGIDTHVPLTGTISHALIPGRDFVFEFDINTGYSLVFLYTLGPRLGPGSGGVYDLMIDLVANSLGNTITVDFFASIPNGVIYNNLIFGTATGITLSALATCSINGNTIDNNRTGLSIQNSIANVRNNLITGFELAGIVTDGLSLLTVQRNDIYSSIVVKNSRSGIVDTDLLLRSIDALAINWLVRTPAKYQVGMIIQVDSEQMLVQGTTSDTIIVSRGQNNTTYAPHSSGSTITIFQLNEIFTVTGIQGDTCSLIETDVFGAPITASVPIQMRALSANTFRAVFPINRRADFYYRYKYSTSGNPIIHQTEIKVFQRSQFGVGVNDIVSIFHEIPLSLLQFTPNMENYSADPLYVDPTVANYSYPAITSVASRQNPIYGSLILPNALHRYVGFVEVRLNTDLAVGATRVPVFAEPLIISSLTAEVRIIGIDINNSGVLLLPASFSFAITPAEADQGATGVFLLSTPLTLSQAGTYQVQYRRPVDLGTSLPPYYIQASISYVFDVGSPVVFDTLTFAKDALGGNVSFTFQVADTLAELDGAPLSIASDVSPISITEVGTNTGQVIQVNITLSGNDSSYSPELLYQFPVLEDLSLSYTPAKDSQLYKVLSLSYNAVENLTNILIDTPVTVDTFSAVGTDSLLDVFVRKKSDSFNPSLEFIMSIANGIAVGDTAIQAHGNLLVVKPDASAGDIIRVDYMSYTSGQETLYAVTAGTQVTGNTYGNVESISSTFIRDGKAVLPTIETLLVESVTQPTAGQVYQVSYAFEAPLDGETLNIAYTYNQLVRVASQNALGKSSLFTDLQVRQVTTVPVTIGISLAVSTTGKPTAIQIAVANAISQLFSQFVDVTVVRTLNASEITRATGGIAGIEDIQVTTLSRTGIIGEVSTLTFQKRESPILASGSPRISTTQNGQAITLNNSSGSTGT